MSQNFTLIPPYPLPSSSFFTQAINQRSCPTVSTITIIQVKLDANFECASLNEMDLVLRCGASPSSLLYGHPAKIRSQLVGAVSRNVNLVVFDSECELKKLEELHPDCCAVMRLQNQCEEAMCDLSRKFGVSMECVPRLLKVAEERNINVVGVSFHVGSYCTDPKEYGFALEEVLFSFTLYW